MRKKLGVLLMALGLLLIAAAAWLIWHNRAEDSRAGEAASETLSVLKAEISPAPEGDSALPEAAADIDPTMNTVEINGYLYIGYLSLPSLGLELPVMEAWDYTRLNIAPCRYTGSYKTDNLVIAAHNYTKHFGRLSSLSLGDEIIFTDADGKEHEYEVVSVEKLDPYAVTDMTESGYALTLFTCTYGGQNRVTVRCMRTDK